MTTPSLVFERVKQIVGEGVAALSNIIPMDMPGEKKTVVKKSKGRVLTKKGGQRKCCSTGRCCTTARRAKRGKKVISNMELHQIIIGLIVCRRSHLQAEGNPETAPIPTLVLARIVAIVATAAHAIPNLITVVTPAAAVMIAKSIKRRRAEAGAEDGPNAGRTNYADLLVDCFL